MIEATEALPEGTIAVFTFGDISPKRWKEQIEGPLLDEGIACRVSEAGNLLDPGVVHLSLAENAKGLEFDTAILVFSPDYDLADVHGSTLEVAKNRMYVGMSRARRALRLLSCDQWPTPLEGCVEEHTTG